MAAAREIVVICLFIFLQVANAGRCSIDNIDLVNLKKDVAYPIDFCKFWNANTDRQKSPFKDLSIGSLYSACACVKASPSLAGSVHSPTALPTVTVKLNQCSSKDPAVVVLRNDLRDPANFCSYWRSTSNRGKSPFPLLSPAKVASICHCAAKTSSILNKPTSMTTPVKPTTSKTSSSKPSSKPTTTPRGPSSSSRKPTSGSTTATSHGRATTSGNPTTKGPSISVTTRSSVNSVSTSTTSLKGEKFFSPVSVAAPPMATLQPIVPPGFNRTSLVNLAPASISNLYFSGAPSDNSSSGTVAAVGLTLQHPSIVLDHTSYISSVSCSSTTMTIKFNSATAYTYSRTKWPTQVPLIFITSSSTCGTAGSNAMFLAKAVAVGSSANTLTAQGSQVKTKDVYHEMTVELGALSTNKTVKPTTPACASATKALFPTAACGTNFDAALDKELTFYSIASADQLASMEAFVPGLNVGNKLIRRDLVDFIDDIGSDISSWCSDMWTGLSYLWDISKLVWQYAAPDWLKTAVEVAVDVAVAVVRVVAMLLPTVEVSQTFDFDFSLWTTDLPDLALTDCPFGEQKQQLQIYEWEPSAGDDPEEYKKWEDGIAKLGDDYVGGANPKPGISVFCVDCGVEGSISTTGSFGVQAAYGITKCQVSFGGSLEASIGIGLDAFAQLKKTFTRRIATLGLPGFSIPEIVDVGPYLSLDVQAALNISAEGQLWHQMTLEWPDIDVLLDAVDPGDSYIDGLIPISVVNNSFHGEVTAVVSLGLPVTLAFGVNILDGTWEKAVKFINTPAIAGIATYSFEVENSDVSNNASAGTSDSSVNDDDDCQGIEWEIALTDDTELNLFDIDTYQLYWWQSPALAEGCVGSKRTNTSSTTTRTLPTGTANPTRKTTTTTSTSSTPLPTSGVDRNITCPGEDRTKFTDLNGNIYQIFCARDYTGTNMNQTAVQTWSLPECMAQCDITTGCIGVVYTYDYVAANTPPRCVLKSTRGNALIDSGVGRKLVGAFLAGNNATNSSQSTTTVSTRPVRNATCAEDDLTVYTDVLGQGYMVFCGYQFRGGDIGLTNTTAKSLQDCMVQCDLVSNCLGIQYTTNITIGNSTPTCMLKSLLGDTYVDYGSDRQLIGAFQVAAPSPTPTSTTSTTSAIPTATAWPDRNITCPNEDNTVFYDLNAVQYQIFCDQDSVGYDIGKSEVQTYSLPECMTQCDFVVDCVGVVFTYNSTTGAAPDCSLKSAEGRFTTDEGTGERIANAFKLSYLESAFSKRGLTKTEPHNIRRNSVTTSSPSSAASSSSTVKSVLANITDTTGILAIQPAADGNLHVVRANTTETPFTIVKKSILTADNRLLHYYPSVMSNYSVSRIRLAKWGSIPKTATQISFVPLAVKGTNTTILITVDSVGQSFMPVACSLEGQPYVKVFLVRNATTDLSYLKANELQTTVMGGIVDECHPLALTAKGIGG